MRKERGRKGETEEERGLGRREGGRARLKKRGDEEGEREEG